MVPPPTESEPTSSQNGRHDPTVHGCGMSPRTRPQLGPALGATRRKRHLSLRDLADLIGVSLNTLSRVERGQMPDLKNYQRIVEWLELPADTFLETDDP